MKRSSTEVCHSLGEPSKKRKYDSSSESSSSSDQGESSRKRKKSKKKKRNKSDSSSSESDKKARKHKHKKSKKKKDKKEKKKKKKDKIVGPEVPEELIEKSKKMAPMTEEEWTKQQSVIQRVYDPETGRTRLIRGSGEVLEEIVSRDRHKEINKLATKGDGDFFQNTLAKKHL